MSFRDDYTTSEKIAADTKGIEVKKATVSNGEYALAELLDALVKEIRRLK